jgi:hypothetical protein
MRFAPLLAAASLFAQIPVEEASDHHPGYRDRTVFILEPLFPPGHSTLEHVHRYDGVSVCIQGSVMSAKPPGGDWGEGRQLCQPGGVSVNEYTGKPGSHSVRNVGKVTTHLRLIENIRESGWTTFPAVEAAGLTMTKESRAFRSYDVEPGGAVHTHPVLTVVVLISGQATTLGNRLDADGAIAVIPAGQAHSVGGDGRVVEVEIR